MLTLLKDKNGARRSWLSMKIPALFRSSGELNVVVNPPKRWRAACRDCDWVRELGEGVAAELAFPPARRHALDTGHRRIRLQFTMENVDAGPIEIPPPRYILCDFEDCDQTVDVDGALCEIHRE